MNSTAPKMTSFVALMAVQLIMLVIFYFFVRYSDRALPADSTEKPRNYSHFQDIHVMIFIGFGFLMTFLRKFGYSATGYALLLASLIVQWAILAKGYFKAVDGKISLSLDNIISADIAAAVPLISMGALLGRTTPIQVLFMALFEVALFAANEYLQLNVLSICDVGGSITVHAFGAYFGLAVSFMLRPVKDQNNAGKYEGASYVSDLFAMLGSLFLWVFWPSFNSVLADGSGQERAILNTYLSLTAATVTTFVLSTIVSKENKFDMVHVQNSTLAGGVAIGSVCNLLIGPYGAVLIGILAGTVSVLGYRYATPFLQSTLRIHDTCGVHNLHGMPALLSGVASAIYAFLVTKENYKNELMNIFPAMASHNVNTVITTTNITATHIHVSNDHSGNDNNNDNHLASVLGGYDRSAPVQAGYQLLGIALTVLIAIVGGVLTGLMLKLVNVRKLDQEEHHQDSVFWEDREPKEE